MLNSVRFSCWYCFQYIKYNYFFSFVARKLELFPYEKYFESSRWKGYRVYVRTLCLIFINGHLTLKLKSISSAKLIASLNAIKFQNTHILESAKKEPRLILTCPHTGAFFNIYASLLINHFHDREVVFLHNGLSEILDLFAEHPLATDLNFSHVHVRDRKEITNFFRSKKSNVVICMLFDLGDGYGQTSTYPLGKISYEFSMSLGKVSRLFDASVLLFSGKTGMFGIKSKFVSLHPALKENECEQRYMIPFYAELRRGLEDDPGQWDRWQNIDNVI